MEKIKHVVTHTLCTNADANIATTKENITSGTLLWNPCPNIRFSKLLTAVRTRMKTIDPMNPPTIVMYSEPPSCCLNICITAKHTTVSVADNIRDGPVDTAKKWTACMIIHNMEHDTGKSVFCHICLYFSWTELKSN